MKSRPETASIEFGDDLAEAELRGDLPAVGVEVDARERARAERQAAGLVLGEGKARAVAREHPEVGEQVMARGRPAGRAAGGCSRAAASRGAPRRGRAATPISSPIAACATAARSRVYIARSVTTWSLRERAVCSRPPTGPASSVRRRSIAMWMSSSSAAKGKRPSRSSSSTASSPAEQRVAILRGDDLRARQHPRVRARLRDVLRPQPPVEVDRGVQALEVGVLGFAEAGHGRSV